MAEQENEVHGPEGDGSFYIDLDNVERHPETENMEGHQEEESIELIPVTENEGRHPEQENEEPLPPEDENGESSQDRENGGRLTMRNVPPEKDCFVCTMKIDDDAVSEYYSAEEDMFDDDLDDLFDMPSGSDSDWEPDDMDREPTPPLAIASPQKRKRSSSTSPTRAIPTPKKPCATGTTKKTTTPKKTSTPKKTATPRKTSTPRKPSTPGSQRKSGSQKKSGSPRKSRSPRKPRSPRKVHKNCHVDPSTWEHIPPEKRWHDIEEEDIDVPKIEFKPARPPGPQKGSRSATTPLDYFCLFFTKTIIKTIVKNTNEYGLQKLQDKWCEMDEGDLFSFLAIVIYMGIVKLPQMADYWKGSELFNLPFPPSVMSRNRFFAIASALHLSDIKKDKENDEKRGTPAYDRLAKIKPLYPQIVEACKNNFHPEQHISVDERMVASKARISLKQYVKNKPHKWGYELFVLADSNSGYTWNFYVYEGKTEGTGKGLSYDTVMTLVDFDMLGKGYHLYVDNFYTSPALFRDLLDKHTGACGTIRMNRIGFPRTTVNDTVRGAPRGTIKWLREGRVVFVKWVDTREVVMCSTIHKAVVGNYVQRRVREAGRWVPKDVPIPLCIREYNQHMGGVDLSDALIGYYTVHHKTQKWYKTFFFHFVDIAIVNAHILHQKKATSPRMAQKAFRQALVEQLATLGSEPTSQSSSQTVTTADTTTIAPWLAKSHLPQYMNEGLDIEKGSVATTGRRNCRHCHRKTPLICLTCCVPLCLVPNRNCYKEWHIDKKV